MAKFIPIAPPSRKQLDALKKYLRSTVYLETAFALAGIPARFVVPWIAKGRAGEPDFAEFVQLIDETNAKLEHSIMDSMLSLAEGGSTEAMKFIFTNRIKPRGDHRMKKLLEAEDRIEAEENEAVISEEEVAAAARRAEEALESEVH